MKIFKSKIFIGAAVVVLFLVIRHIYVGKQAFKMPEYDKVDISEILDKTEKTDADYNTIFSQTGLSPYAADELIASGKTDTINQLHDLYFQKPEFKKEYILYPFTAEEAQTNQLTPLVPLKDGDILVTFNTMTCDWRHGHCAIVTDAKTSQAIEHMAVGQTSCYTRAYMWGRYPSFAVLRYPDEKVAKQAAQYAKEHLIDIKYNIFSGILKKDKSDEEIPESSHCSHIVWQAYKAVGVDIDFDGGILVTPNDISKSKELEVVQIFGMNPKKYESRLLKRKVN